MDDVVNALDESYFEIEYLFKKKTGDWVWCLSREKIFTWDVNNQAESFIGTFIDITRIKNLELELKSQARLDYLTGVDNRRSLNDKLNQEFNRSQRYKSSFSLLIIDIDNFKAINDTYGHSIGDDFLVHLSTHIKKLCAIVTPKPVMVVTNLSFFCLKWVMTKHR
jgi:PleD family two-component response regulator